MSILPHDLPKGDGLSLAQRIQNRDQLAIRELLEEHGPKIETILARRYFSLCQEDLEEIIVEAVWLVWSKADLFDPNRGSLQGWFFTIAKNLTNERLSRPRLQREEMPVECIAQVVVPPSRANPEPRPGIEADLHCLLQKVPEIDRRIAWAYALARGEGAWAAELALQLNIPSGAIRQRWLRLKRKLHNALVELGHEERNAG